jgi:hypothetical protein
MTAYKTSNLYDLCLEIVLYKQLKLIDFIMSFVENHHY